MISLSLLLVTSFPFPCFNEHQLPYMQDIEEESGVSKKPSSARGGSGSKRSRAAEVHNLSERVSNTYLLSLITLITFVSIFISCKQRRRDRINEKMRALQELIPNCNKVWLPSYDLKSQVKCN